MQCILPDQTYDNLVTALLNVEPNAFSGEITRHEIIWVLADAGVFPARSEAAELELGAAA